MAGDTRVAVLRDIMPDITMEKILRLEFWEKRTKGLRIRTYEIRAEIESKVSLLRETRFNDYAADLKILCEKLPNT